VTQNRINLKLIQPTRRQKRGWLIFAIILLFSACTPAPSVNTSTPSSPPVNVTPVSATPVLITPNGEIAPTQVSASSPTPTTEIDTGSLRVQYVLDVSLEYDQKTAGVHQTITLTNLPESVGSVTLMVEPNLFPNVFLLNLITVNDQPLAKYSLQRDQLTFDLPEPIDRSLPVTVGLNFQLFIPVNPFFSGDIKPQVFGYTTRQLNLTDWYAIVPPLDASNQWMVRDPAPFGETLVYADADFEVHLKVTGNQVPLVVAGSSNPIRSENIYDFKLSQARNFAITLSPDYQVIEQQVEGITIRAYGFADSILANQAVLDTAVKAVKDYSRLFGVLPRQAISIIQADFLDGMEFDGLVFVSKGFYNLYDGTIRGYLSLITAHELAHQWWYGQVGNDQALEPWLDEGLATFAELQFLEIEYPEDVNWWWSYRVDYYAPVGPINLPVEKYKSYISYRNAVYLVSAKFLFELRETIGSEAFIAALQRFYQTNQRKIADASTFWRAFEGVPGYPFAELREKYFVKTP